jgi:UDP-glucose 4-epimerase
MEKRTALITGVAGFIGRYTARHFFERGYSVTGIDIRSPENAPTAFLTSYHQLNLPNPALETLLQQIQPEVCIHCAGRASVGLSVTDPVPDFYSASTLVFETLRAIRESAPACKFLFLSSAAVYGNPSSLPVSEDQPAAPISPYGFHKLQAEIVCQEFAQVYGLSTASTRIFSAYGPGLRRQVVWDICRKVFAGGPLVLQGINQESRDFIHARDIVRAFDTLIQKAPFHGEVYNLACGQEVTIHDLAREILDCLRQERQIIFNGDLPQGVPARWQADISKIKALSYHPEIRLEDGLRATAQWCRAELLGD